MRIAGRMLFSAFLVALLIALTMLVRAGVTATGLTTPAAGQADEVAQPSLVYPLRRLPSKFVLSRPQERVRILTNAELRPGATEPHYGFVVEALDARGATAWRREIHVRTLPLFVRNRRGKLVPHVFLAEPGALQLSAADATLIDFGRPVSALRLRATSKDLGVGRVLARVQEQRPMSPRQLEVGWQRLNEDAKAQLTAGNPLGSALTGEDERQRLLIQRWSPVGPAGVEGRDYLQTILYERHGPARASRAEK